MLLENQKKTIDEIDNWYDEYRLYSQELDPHLKSLQNRESSIIKQKKEISINLEEISNTSDLLAKLESVSTQNQVRDLDLGSCFHELYVLLQECALETNQLARDENEQFNHTLKDYIRYMDSIKQIINNRDIALLNWQNDVRDLDSKREKQSNSGDNPKIAQSIKLAEEAVEESKNEYGRLSESVKIELTNFQKLKRVEITKAIKNLVQINMDYHMKVGNLWKGLYLGLESNDIFS